MPGRGSSVQCAETNRRIAINSAVLKFGSLAQCVCRAAAGRRVASSGNAALSAIFFSSTDLRLSSKFENNDDA